MEENMNEKKSFAEKAKTVLINFGEWFLKFIRNPSGIFALFVIVLVLLNLVASRGFFRWDITSPKSYSLSSSSKEIVKTVDEPLNIKVFFSEGLQAPYSTTYQYVKDILSEYKSAGNENFSYEFFDMNKDENIQLAQSFGIQQIQIQEIKNNEFGFKNVFMGLVVSYSDQVEVLNGLVSSDGLEYKITGAINKVVANTNALIGLSGGIDVVLYQSSNMKTIGIDGLSSLEQNVNSIIDFLNRKYENKLKFVVQDPDSDDVLKLVDGYGIPSYQFENENGEISYGTICIVLESGEKSRVVPIKIGQGFDVGENGIQIRWGIQGLEDLEDNIDESLKALASNVSSVAYVTGHGEHSLSDSQTGAAYLNQILGERYLLKEVNLSESDIPLDVSCVMINGPKSQFTQDELYKLDQFLMSGGNLLMFIDPMDSESQRNEYGMIDCVPIDTGLETLLEKYGITLNKEFVMDEECAKTQDQWTGMVQDLYFAPMLKSDSLNQKHGITKNLGDVMFFLPGTIDSSAAKNISGEKVTVLATTSKKSWTEGEDVILEPDYIMPPAESAESSFDVAVLVEGKFSSAFESAPEEIVSEDESEENKVYKSSTHLSSSTQNGKVLLVATSYVANQYLSESIFRGTSILVENMVDYMCDSEDLCSMRTKGLSLASLDVKSNVLANFVKYFNEIGLAIIVALIGLLVLVMRKKRRTLIRLKYNPGDSREEPKKVLKTKSSIKNERGQK